MDNVPHNMNKLHSSFHEKSERRTCRPGGNEIEEIQIHIERLLIFLIDTVYISYFLMAIEK